jgi:membrane-bound inhibitor of C-type lysozyme
VGPAFSANYACPDGVVVQAAYINPETGPSLAVIAWGGRLIPMQDGPAASGARYAAFGDAGGYVWWTRGDEATLLYVNPEDMDAEETVVTGCQRIGG